MKISFKKFLFIFLALFIWGSQDSYSQFWKRKPDKIGKSPRLEKNNKSEVQAEFYFIEGMRYIMLEDYEKARTNFEKALENNPDLAAAHYKIGDSYLIQGDPMKAKPYAVKALELDRSNKAYYLLVARVYEYMQNYEKAAATLVDLLENVEGVQEHYFDLALIQTYLEDYESALTTYDKIQEFFGPTTEVMQQKQRLLLRLNRLDEAIAVGSQMIEDFPNDEEVVYNHVRLLIANDKMGEARKALDDILLDRPENPEALILLSDVYRSKGEIDSANIQLNKAFRNSNLNLESKIAIVSNLMRFSFGEAEQKSLLNLTEILIESHPKESRAYTFRADVLLNYSMKKEALKAYKTAILLDENSLLVWTNIVLLHFEFEDYDSVSYYAEKALEIFPNQGRLWFMNGLGYYSINNFTSALKSLETAEKYIIDDKRMRNDVLSTLGDTYNSLKQYEKSDESYEKALELDPNNEHVLNNYSYFLSLRGEKLDKAKEMCKVLMTIAPENSTYLDTYAWVLYKNGDYKDALEYIEKAIKGTESGVVLEHYGDILFKLNRKDEALEAWKRAKEFEDASELIDKKIEDKILYEE
jgi:tetratricopeptide (TPR) repeat protein